MNIQLRKQIKRTISQPENLTIVRSIVARPENKTVTAIASAVCEEFSFFDALGKSQISTCISALRILAKKKLFSLPVQIFRPKGKIKFPPLLSQSQTDSVEGKVNLVLVETNEEKNLWYASVQSSFQQPLFIVGREIKYLFYYEGALVGGVSFFTTLPNLKDRDLWLGWSQEERLQKLDFIVRMGNLHFSSAISEDLALKFLLLSVESCKKDFEAKYGIVPVLLETIIDTPFLRKICHKAKWTRVTPVYASPLIIEAAKKIVFVLPLEENFRQIMGLSNDSGRYALPKEDWLGANETFWETELADTDFADARLVSVFVEMVKEYNKNPQMFLTTISKGDKNAAKRFYRWIENKKSNINEYSILHSHLLQTIRRMANEEVVLCVQDTTDLVLTSKQGIEGLGYLSANQTGAKSYGLKIHTTHAFTVDGFHLGILNVSISAPQEREKEEGKKIDYSAIPLEEKSTYKWVNHAIFLNELAECLPGTQLVCVGDREMIFNEFISEIRDNCPNIYFLGRATDRTIVNKDGEQHSEKLFATGLRAESKGKKEFTVERQSERPKLSKQVKKKRRARRKATLRLSSVTVYISAPDRAKDKSPMNVNLVYAGEIDQPKDDEKVEWFLITNLPIHTLDDIENCINFYLRRWRIEEWHRLIKDGCHIKEIGFRTADRLRRGLAITMLVAWRIMLMTLMGREVPNLPPDIFFDEYELEILRRYAAKKNLNAPTYLGMAVRTVAHMGGYLGRKCDPEPCFSVYCRGYVILQNYYECLKLFNYKLVRVC